jgi:hypothetical protein
MTGSLRSHPSPAASDAVRNYSPSGIKGVPSRWTPAELAKLRDAYYGPRPLKVISHAFNTNDSTIHRFARRFGWKRRRQRQATIGGV